MAKPLNKMRSWQIQSGRTRHRFKIALLSQPRGPKQCYIMQLATLRPTLGRDKAVPTMSGFHSYCTTGFAMLTTSCVASVSSDAKWAHTRSHTTPHQVFHASIFSKPVAISVAHSSPIRRARLRGEHLSFSMMNTRSAICPSCAGWLAPP